MKRSLASAFSAATLSGILMAGPLVAVPQEPDNTVAKQSDRSDSPNADKAKNDAADRELMRHIRHDLIQDKSLSTYAHNVKVVAINGKVTLRGPVRSEDEKKAIEEHAAKYAGAGNVINELTVKGS